jgi:hypothetical protein
MRRLSDRFRPYLLDLLAAAAGLLGAVAIGYPLFGPYAAGDAPWLHGVFLGFVAIMLLGTVRFLVRTMDLPEIEVPSGPGAARPTGRARSNEPGAAGE